jgi:hypothetical protein
MVEGLLHLVFHYQGDKFKVSDVDVQYVWGGWEMPAEF